MTFSHHRTRWSLAGAAGFALLAGTAAVHAHEIRALPEVAGTELAAGVDASRVASNDSAAVARVVERFHAALEAGDGAAALQLLTDDVRILESGGMEDREEYRSHHLASDIEFARAVPRQAGAVDVTVRGDVAWATSTSISRGTFRERQINSQTAELMILERTESGWRIAAIHWSSRQLRT